MHLVDQDNETPETPKLAAKVYEITYDTETTDEQDDPVYDYDTVSGFLAVTPGFIGLTDDTGRVIYYRPSYLVKCVEATGDVPEDQSGPVN